MIKLVLFLKKIHYVLLFIILELLAIHYYANSTPYTKVKLVNSSNRLMGGLYNQLNLIGNYFYLRQENRTLVDQLTLLQNEMEGLRAQSLADSSDVRSDTLHMGDLAPSEYLFYSARVVNNSINRKENYITINKGADDGIVPNMTLISQGGIVGYVVACSEHYSVCMSLINTRFNTSGRIKNNEYFGTIFWDGASYEYVTLTEIPKYAPLAVGDTIVTTDYSSFFPPGVMIGTVDQFELRNGTYFEVKVKLQANMAALNYVLVAEYINLAERSALEESVHNPEF